MARNRKRARKKEITQITATPEQKQKAMDARVARLLTLQDRREEQRYIQLLKSAENRYAAADVRRKQLLGELEAVRQEMEDAEGFLDAAATEVAEWETRGIVVDRALAPVAEGQEVVVAHEKTGLGVRPADEKTDPRLIYGKALAPAEQGEKVAVLKKNAPATEGLEVTEAEVAAATLDVGDLINDGEGTTPENPLVVEVSPE